VDALPFDTKATRLSIVLILQDRDEAGFGCVVRAVIGGDGRSISDAWFGFAGKPSRKRGPADDGFRDLRW